MLIVGEDADGVGTSYFLFNFAVNLKLLEIMKSIKKNYSEIHIHQTVKNLRA